MATEQKQLKLSLSKHLNELLQERASDLGLPATQLVKYLIIKEVDSGTAPVYQASEWVEDKSAKALKDLDKAVEIKGFQEFFETL